MKNKDILLIVAFLILFSILTFTTPLIGDKTASMLWLLFFIVIGLLVIIWILISLNKLSTEELIERFKKQPKIIQILDLGIVILLIYEFLTMQNIQITGIFIFLLFFIPFCQWFFKKEED